MHVVLVFLLLTLNMFHTFFVVSIAGLEQVNISWVCITSQSLCISELLQNIIGSLKRAVCSLVRSNADLYEINNGDIKTIL